MGDLVRFLKSESLAWYRSALAAVPGELGCLIRNGLYGYRAQSGCRILGGVIIYFPERLILGRNVGISCDSQLNAAGGIEIGDDTLIGVNGVALPQIPGGDEFCVCQASASRV